MTDQPAAPAAPPGDRSRGTGTGTDSAAGAGDRAEPAARESTDYLAGFSAGYRVACAAHGVFDDAITALSAQNPRQALDTYTARQVATVARAPEKTPAQLRADAFASWGLTDDQAPTRTTDLNDRSDCEEIGP